MLGYSILRLKPVFVGNGDSFRLGEAQRRGVALVGARNATLAHIFFAFQQELAVRSVLVANADQVTPKHNQSEKHRKLGGDRSGKTVARVTVCSPVALGIVHM
jgi:hypothetical protein